MTLFPKTESTATQCWLLLSWWIWRTIYFWYLPSAASANSADNLFANVALSLVLTETESPIFQLDAKSWKPFHWKFPLVSKPPFLLTIVAKAPGLNVLYSLGKLVILVPERAIWIAIDVIKHPTSETVLLPKATLPHSASVCFHPEKLPDVVTTQLGSPLNIFLYNSANWIMPLAIEFFVACCFSLSSIKRTFSTVPPINPLVQILAIL